MDPWDLGTPVPFIKQNLTDLTDLRSRKFPGVTAEVAFQNQRFLFNKNPPGYVTPKFLTASLPLKNGGKGRRSPASSWDSVTFQGRAVKLWGGSSGVHRFWYGIFINPIRFFGKPSLQAIRIWTSIYSYVFLFVIWSFQNLTNICFWFIFFPCTLCNPSLSYADTLILP